MASIRENCLPFLYNYVFYIYTQGDVKCWDVILDINYIALITYYIRLNEVVGNSVPLEKYLLALHGPMPVAHTTWHKHTSQESYDYITSISRVVPVLVNVYLMGYNNVWSVLGR